jgi:hypothetical protein
MSYATYFPEQRHVLANASIRRERLLPEGAVGQLEAREGERVDLRDVIANGALPSRYMIIEAARELRLRHPEELESVLLVPVGEIAEAKQPIAGSQRGRRVLAPVTGRVVYVGDGRIILQALPEPIEVQAALNGTVIEIREDRGVVIETSGAVLQGVWGNDRVTIGALRAEPEQGLEQLTTDALDSSFRGFIFYTRRPLTARALQVMESREVLGVIAPSMEPALRERAQQSPMAVLLTLGFGHGRMSQVEFNFLESLAGKQATLDATQPARFTARRPEVIVNIAARAGQRPPAPSEDWTLERGMNVRLTRGEHAGMSGQITDLPKMPHLLDNGLRLPCAQVQLITGESTFVPLANLEVFGQ